jgi:hypothetical protein
LSVWRGPAPEDSSALAVIESPMKKTRLPARRVLPTTGDDVTEIWHQPPEAEDDAPAQTH